MLITISVRRGSNPAAGIDVLATVGSNDCAGGRTDANGQLNLILPRDNAPSACNEPGATIRYRVNGELIPTTTTFSPQGQSSFQVSLP
jgi:hypothetical protein